MKHGKIILVIGGTGAQGGSVARELLRRGGYTVRVLTRTPAIAEAAALRALGAEIVRGDLFDPASLRAALEDVYGVFAVTSYWEHFEREAELGNNLVEAVCDARVEHLVLSTHPDVSRISGGRLNVPHFDIKARICARAESEGVPLTALRPAFHFDNFATFFAPQRQSDGSYLLRLPLGDDRLAGFATEDTGIVVARAFEAPELFMGRTVEPAGDALSGCEYAAILSRVTGTLIRYRDIPRDVFAGYGFRGAAHIADEFAFHRSQAGHAASRVAATVRDHDGIQTFEGWALRHLRRLERALAA